MKTIINSLDTEAILKEASIKEKTTQFNDAILLYESVIAQNATIYIAYIKLGALHEKMLDNEKAKEVYIKGIETAKYFQNKPAAIDLSYTLLGLID